MPDIKKMTSSQSADELFNSTRDATLDAPQAHYSKKETKKLAKDLNNNIKDAAKKETAAQKQECIKAGNAWSNITNKCINMKK